MKQILLLCSSVCLAGCLFSPSADALGQACCPDGLEAEPYYVMGDGGWCYPDGYTCSRGSSQCDQCPSESQFTSCLTSQNVWYPDSCSCTGCDTDQISACASAGFTYSHSTCTCNVPPPPTDPCESPMPTPGPIIECYVSGYCAGCHYACGSTYCIQEVYYVGSGGVICGSAVQYTYPYPSGCYQVYECNIDCPPYCQ